jgi:hypothetical protein
MLVVGQDLPVELVDTFQVKDGLNGIRLLGQR